MRGIRYGRRAFRGATAIAAIVLCVGGIAGASPGSGKSGAGKIDDKIDKKVETKVEDKAADKVENRSSGKIEDKIQSTTEDKTGGAVEQKMDDRVTGKVEDRAGGAVVDKVEDKASVKTLDRIDNSSSGAVGRGPVSAADDKAAERAAKDAYDKAQKALDAAHRAELDAARAEFERALASGADRDAAKADYDASKSASDAAYDAGRDEARADYAATEAQDSSGNSGPGSLDSGSSGHGSSGSGSSGSGSSEGGSSGGSGGSNSGNSGRGSSNSGSSNSGSSNSGSSDGSKCGGENGGCVQAAGASASFPLFEGEIDEHGALRARGEVLMLAAPREVRALTAAGYETFEIDDLPALGAVLLRVRAPDGLKLEDAQAVLQKAAPAAEIDYNHVYAPSGANPPQNGARAAMPGALMRIEGAGAAHIGVIDSYVDLSHEALADADIVTQDFVSYRDPRPSGHGTSVVSILAGRSARFEGVAAGAKVFEASVFFQPSAGGASATAASIVRAMDWLAGQGVCVINLSLAGPPNDILKGAIDRVQKRGVIVVAAVGNDGPAAAPLYPAAYDGVVGVTAVSRDRRIFRLAGRGAQVDFAAPGVDILHAAASGRYEASSGTSMAAPFVTAAIAAAAAHIPHAMAIEALEHRAEDLGAEGRDPVFGWGLVRPLGR